MREAIVDAAVCAKWVVDEDHSEQAARLLDWDGLHAPDHWQAEAVNAIWSRVFKGELVTADAEERVAVLLCAPVRGTPIARLMPRAFALSVAHMITVYDTLYLALAEQLRLKLVTADQRLWRRASSDATLARQLIWVGDL